ncbi:MAG TPA: hypothetical protein VM425_14205 [Myxococcota bacterium]|nr:hypothetical protein [Myxococcota bacterium]
MSDTDDLQLARIEKYFKRIYNHIEAAELRRRDSWPEIATDPANGAADESDSLFLDYYSVEGLRLALMRYGFMDALRTRGIEKPRLALHRHAEGYDILCIFGSRSQQPIVELVAQVGPLSAEAAGPIDACERKFLLVRWLRMQNLQAKPTPGYPLLPGQDYPGLGLGREMMALLQLICVRLDLDGVVELPERLHNAALYFRRFRFIDPEMQGVLTAILRDTRDRKLAEVAWGIELGGLLDLVSAKPYRWIAREQALARKGPLCEFLDSDEYRRRATVAMERSRFRLETGDLALDQVMARENPFPSRIK